MIGLRRSGSVCLHFFACAYFFALQALLPLCRCPFFLMTSSEVMHPESFLLSPFLQKGGMEVGGLGMPLCSPPARLGPAGRVEEPLVACSVHATSLLSPRFIRGLGIQELLFCGGLLLPVPSRLVLPHDLCTLGEVMGRVRLPSAAPVRVLPGLPIFGLGGREGTLSPLLVGWLSCAVLLLMLSLSLPCSVRRSRRCGRGSSHWLFSLVRSLAVYRPLTVSQRSL